MMEVNFVQPTIKGVIVTFVMRDLSKTSWDSKEKHTSFVGRKTIPLSTL